MFDMAKSIYEQKMISLEQKLKNSEKKSTELQNSNTILREKMFELKNIEQDRDNLAQKEKKYLSRENNLKDEFQKWRQVF